jgi:hypothetical protein
MNEEAKARKQMGPIELFSEDAGVLTKLAIQPPQDLRSTDALVRWLKANAEIDGRYVFARRLASVDLKIESVRSVSAVVS